MPISLTLICENLDINPGNGARLNVALFEVETSSLLAALPEIVREVGPVELAKCVGIDIDDVIDSVSAQERRAIFNRLKSQFGEES